MFIGGVTYRLKNVYLNFPCITNYQNFMKLKLNMYQYNMAINIKSYQNVSSKAWVSAVESI